MHSRRIFSRRGTKYPWHGEMSQGMLDTAETLAREAGDDSAQPSHGSNADRAARDNWISWTWCPRENGTHFIPHRWKARAGISWFRAEKSSPTEGGGVGGGRGLIGDEIWDAGRKAQGIFDYHREGAIKSVDAIVADSGRRGREWEGQAHFSRAFGKKPERGYVNVATTAATGRRDEMRSLVECQPEKFLGRRRHTQFIRGTRLRHNFALAISREQCWMFTGHRGETFG